MGPGIGGFTDLYCRETVIVQSSEMKKGAQTKEKYDLRNNEHTFVPITQT